MYRSLLAIFLAFSTALLMMEPAAFAQDGPQDPSAGTEQPYPQDQQYPPTQPSPQDQQYPPPQDSKAQQYPQGTSDAQDIAGDQQHGVARLSIVQGDVNVKLGSTGELVAGAVNAPLVSQDHVQTSPGSRAEVELDYANLIRLAPNTDVGFADLEYHRFQVQLAAGTMIYRVLRDSAAQAEIDTPSIAIRPARQGEYRISVLDDGTTQITVRSGEVEVYSPNGSQYLEAGRTMLVRGDASNPEFQTTYEIARDQLDDWSANRDRELLASQSYRYVSPDIYGADDLDAYGNWVPSQYGNVWEPRDEGADWAPYSNGQWVDEPYYGWSWVDYAPWGWAPYHYGRWFNNPGYGWCWWPGAIGSPYYWNPALVGFFGWGGFGLSLGFGGLGWVALAPFELFHPWWGRGWGGGYGRGWGFGRYGNYGNFRNTNITNIYRNAGIRGAAITASGNSFGQGRTAYGRATRAQLQNASLIRGQIPVRATQASSRFSNRQAVANPRLATAANRHFFTHQQPTQSARAGFSQQQNRSQQPLAAGRERAGTGFATNQRGAVPASNGRNSAAVTSRSAEFANRSVNNSQFSGAQQSMHGVPPNMRGGQASSIGRSTYSTHATSGWQRFGDPGNSGSMRQGFVPGTDRSGWHSFGEPSGTRSAVAPQQRSFSTPGYSRSYAPNSSRSFGGNYQSRPLQTPRGSSGFANEPLPSIHYGTRSPSSSPHYNAPAPQRYSAPSGPHYSAPSTPHYSAPSTPHYSAPSAPRSSGGGSFHGGGGGSRGDGGGHPSSGGHHR